MEPGGWLVKLAQVRQIRPAASWGLLFALFLAALGARAGFSNQLNLAPFAPFFLALLVAAVICGWKKSVVLMIASAIVGWTFFAARPMAISPSFDVRVAAFLLGGGCAVALIEGLVRTVQQLQAAAALNHDLFRELQHRVSNNFQIVAATLEKARRAGVADPVAADAINAATARIHSLARLHRRLYEPASYAKGLAPMLREVLEDTFHGVAVEVVIDADTHGLPVNDMISLVLFVNEAAINSAKHVFRPSRGRLFSVSLKDVGTKRLLIVRDDGPGFAATTLDPGRPRYGISVMRGLATQLGGAVEFSETSGAVIRLTF